MGIVLVLAILALGGLGGAFADPHWLLLTLFAAPIPLAWLALRLAASNRRRRRLGDLATLDAMNGKDFEAWIEEQLRRRGIACESVSGGSDYGVDLIASVRGLRVAIQAKRYDPERKVGNRAVQEVIAGASYYTCDRACVVTQTGFTKPARSQAEACEPRVALVGRTELAGLAGRLRELARRSA